MLSRRKFLQIAAASTGIAVSGTELLAQAAAKASSAIRPGGSNGIRHIVILMMENRSFDHFLGWVPGANPRGPFHQPAPGTGRALTTGP